MRNRNSGSNGRYKRVVLLLILLPILAWAEQIWTDFSPQPNVIVIENPQEDEVIVMVKDEPIIDKEKYRVYFEDRELVNFKGEITNANAG